MTASDTYVVMLGAVVPAGAMGAGAGIVASRFGWVFGLPFLGGAAIVFVIGYFVAAALLKRREI